MLRLLPFIQKTCSGWTRREMLQVGGLSLFGLTWADRLRAESAAPSATGLRNTFGRARSCVVIFLFGGPGQQDLWDMKPDALDEARGEFRPTATRVPGVNISEQLPHLTRQTDKFTIVRSVSHRDFEHGSAAYTALTGHPHPAPGTNTPVSPDDFPTYGSVAARLRPARRPVPNAVTLGPVMHQGNRPPLAGQNAGFLGRGSDPFRIADDPSEPDFRIESLTPSNDLPANRVQNRRRLMDVVDDQARMAESSPSIAGMGELYQRAFALLHSSQTRRAFDLSREAVAVRDRYGRNKFGQTLLLARRLVEAGVPFVTINWAQQNGDQWDTHRNNYPRLREMLPRFDRGLAAFLADLSNRGLLDSTLVYCLGEFGRTPTINRDAGRDHWPDCYSVLMGGGGIRTGTVYGASDRRAAYPIADRVTPWDLAATLFHCAGIEGRAHLVDRQDRPLPITVGRVVDGLLG